MVLSVLLQVGREENPFLEQMNIESWEFPLRNAPKTGKIDDRLKCLQILKREDTWLFPDLDTLLAGRKQEYSTSYFLYQGSLNKPPCK